MSTTLADIHDFLDQRRIALVGVSRDPKDFSRMLFREMCKRGYDMVPVNPAASELESRRCFAGIRDINPPADGVLVMTSPQETEGVVQDCIEVGIRRVWMYRAAGQGAVNEKAAELCHEKGITLVKGYCPYMFLPRTPFFHRVHGLLLKLSGGYPKASLPTAAAGAGKR